MPMDVAITTAKAALEGLLEYSSQREDRGVIVIDDLSWQRTMIPASD